MLAASAFKVLQRSNYTAVIDDRFTGGHITRSNGDPGNGVHAIQLELTWRNYMEEAPPFRYLPKSANKLKPVLRELLKTLIEWQPPAP